MGNEHRIKRHFFYQTLSDFWHDLYETEYALYDVKKVSKEEVERIRVASERIGRIFYKTSSLLRQLNDETLLQLGFPAAILPYIRFKSISYDSVIARLDLVVTKEEMKVLEFNSDTPTFIKEVFHVNEQICRHWRLQNPNEQTEKQLADSIAEAIKLSLKSLGITASDGKVVFSSHNDHQEDYLTTQYLLEMSGFQAEYIPLQALKLVEEDIIQNGECVLTRGLYTPDFEKIDVLYRQTYPLEYLIFDCDPITNTSVGDVLLQLVMEQKLAIINPPSSFLLQSKAVMALIWGMHEQAHSFYSEEEHQWIEQYFLPTYLEEHYFRKNGIAYVQKPSFGREGDTVRIFQSDGSLLHENEQKKYEMELPVYQKYIKLPKQTIQTEKGLQKASFIYGSFILNGKASAIGIRAGDSITNNTSFYLPIAMNEQEEHKG